MTELYEDERLIGSAEVCRILGGCVVTTLYRKMNSDPTFPKPMRNVVSSRLTWRLSAIKAWVAERERESATVA